MNILRHPAVIIVLILLVVLLFGSKRLPDFARSVGQSLKIFKKEVKELKDDGKDADTPAADVATPSNGVTPADSATPSDGATPPPGGAPVPGGPDQPSTSQQIPGLTDPNQPRA